MVAAVNELFSMHGRSGSGCAPSSVHLVAVEAADGKEGAREDMSWMIQARDIGNGASVPLAVGNAELRRGATLHEAPSSSVRQVTLGSCVHGNHAHRVCSATSRNDIGSAFLRLGCE